MILFIDIETVPCFQHFEELSESMQKLWTKKTKFYQSEDHSPEMVYNEKAGIFAEFSKVVCIGLGYYDETKKIINTKGIISLNELEILEEFKLVLAQFRRRGEVLFCGHNIKEFDLPFLCRRLVINQIKLPDELDLSGKKPWENHHIDTMDMWKFGEYKRFTSLDLLAQVLGIESPKTIMDGSEVARVYFEDKDLEKIKTYCLQDVVSTAKVYYRLLGETPEISN